jgi:hypothetical protein
VAYLVVYHFVGPHAIHNTPKEKPTVEIRTRFSQIMRRRGNLQQTKLFKWTSLLCAGDAIGQLQCCKKNKKEHGKWHTLGASHLSTSSSTAVETHDRIYRSPRYRINQLKIGQQPAKRIRKWVLVLTNHPGVYSFPFMLSRTS